MRWGAALVAVLCLALPGCSEDAAVETVEGAWFDPSADVRGVLFRADEDLLRINAVDQFLFSDRRLTVRIWSTPDDDPVVLAVMLDGVFRCTDPGVCTKRIGSADGGGVIEIPRKALPRITSASRLAVQPGNGNPTGPPPPPARSLAWVWGEAAGSSGVRSVAVVVARDGALRLVIDDPPAGAGFVRVYLAADEQPLYRYGLTLREGEDVDMSLGKAPVEIPELWEFELVTAAGTTRRVAATRL